ncbi:MAG: hypothetical protein P8166_04945 [Candidatus Thiodiazotropha sp.]
MIARPTRRLTVVLHDSPQSPRLLDLGARIASQLQAELEAVFVEDAALYRLTGLPFLRELKRDSFTEQRLDGDRLLKEWRATAKLAREALESSATRAGLSWSFRVWRGEFDKDLQDLALESPMLLLGRLCTPATNRYPAAHVPGPARIAALKLGVILDSGETAERLLEAIGELSRKPEIQLILFLLPDGEPATGSPMEQRLGEIDPQRHNILLRLSDKSPATLLTGLKAAACDLLMISESSELLQGDNMKQRLKGLPYPVVVVR